MNKIKFSIFILILIVLTGCKTLEKKTNDMSTWDMEKYILESFKLTDNAKYREAIDLLNGAMAKFPDGDIILVNYNIGFNYYLMKKYDDANGYFNTVISLYSSSNLSEAQKAEDKKFNTLSNIMIEKIKVERDDAKDPYHAKEEIEKNKILRSQKKEKK